MLSDVDEVEGGEKMEEEDDEEEGKWFGRGSSREESDSLAISSSSMERSSLL